MAVFLYLLVPSFEKRPQRREVVAAYQLRDVGKNYASLLHSSRRVVNVSVARLPISPAVCLSTVLTQQ